MLRPRVRCICRIGLMRPYRRRCCSIGINADDMVDIAIPLQGRVLVQRPRRVSSRIHVCGHSDVGVFLRQLGPCP